MNILHDPVQKILYRIQILSSVQINISVIPVIPVSNSGKQPNGSDNRLGKRNDYLKKRLRLRCPVNIRRFNDLIRNTGCEIRFHEQNVKSVRHQTRQQQPPESILNVENIHVIDIGRNQSTVKQHSKENVESKNASCRKFFLGNCIRKQCCNRQRKNRSHSRKTEGYEIRLQNLRILYKNIMICIQTELFRKITVTVPNQCVIVCKGRDDHQEQGSHRKYCHDYHNNITHKLKTFFVF